MLSEPDFLFTNSGFRIITLDASDQNIIEITKLDIHCINQIRYWIQNKKLHVILEIFITNSIDVLQ